MEKATEQTIANFGGIDMLISNAGIFPKSAKIVDMDAKNWQKLLHGSSTKSLLLINLFGCQRLMNCLVMIFFFLRIES